MSICAGNIFPDFCYSPEQVFRFARVERKRVSASSRTLGKDTLIVKIVSVNEISDRSASAWIADMKNDYFATK